MSSGLRAAARNVGACPINTPGYILDNEDRKKDSSWTVQPAEVGVLGGSGCLLIKEGRLGYK